MEVFYIFVFLTAFGLIGYVLQILAVQSYLKDRKKKGHEKALSPRHLPPVSILKPLKGVDDNLFDNLESFCMLDYPEYEIIFSLQDHNDPAYKVARKVKDKYPDKQISIVVEDCSTGLNPKVNNLIPAYVNAKYEYILISDSNVMVNREYLSEIVRHFNDPEVGLVTNLIRGIGGRTLGSVFENLHLNTFIIGSICFLDRYLKMPCVIGKSMLMRKRDLESIGGFNAVKDVLAEDYIIGKKMQKKGKKVILSNYIINNINQYWGMKKFLNRHTRWGKLRWKIGGVKYLSEIITNIVFMSFLPIFFWEPSRLTVSFAGIISCIKIIGDFYMGKKIGTEMNPLLNLVSPLKDLVIGFIWFIPLLSNTVVWRGNRYIIHKDSLLSSYVETDLGSWKYKLADAIKARFV
ncbi:MAG: ceramide glucosyltransferase [Thermodesulfovibrionales bacterium]